MPTDLMEDHALALQLHGVLSEIDPARWRDEMAQSLRRRLAEIVSRKEATPASPRLAPLVETIKTELPQLEQPAPDTRSRWLAFKQRIQPVYASMAAALQAEKVHVPSLRPTNYARNVFHISAAIAAVVIIELVGSPGWVLAAALAWAGFAWSCEISRRVSPAINKMLMWFFGPVAHPHETHRVNSATWYATALVVLALTQSTMLCLVGVAVLGVGDPLAALIGRRFGRTKLIHGRSLEGTLGFVVSASVAAFVLLRIFHAAQLGVGASAMLAVSAAVAGALAELFSLRIDDNVSIPLSAASGGAIALWVMSLPV